MAEISIIGYAFYMKPPSPEQAPEVKISEAAYLALDQPDSTAPIQYAYKRPVFNTSNGNPALGDTFLNEDGELVTWTDDFFLPVHTDIFD